MKFEENQFGEDFNEYVDDELNDDELDSWEEAFLSGWEQAS